MLPGNVPLKMVRIPGGKFMMGRTPNEQSSQGDEEPQHLVVVPEFWIGMCQVTKFQWQHIMDTSPWSGKPQVSDDPDSPAVYVSWDDAQSFINAFNNRTGLFFRLPSEAEWEYACRAGTRTRFYWGDDPEYTVGNDYAWWRLNAWDADEKYAHVVGQKLPNAFGLYDMSGNVWEWCEDWKHPSYTGAPTDGTAWVSPTSSLRVLRGGGWGGYCENCRSANRSNAHPSDSRSYIGFRIVR